MKKRNLRGLSMKTLEHGLDLAMNFVRAAEQAFDNGVKAPREAASDGWTVNIESGFSGPVLRLHGHGMSFIFEPVPLANQLAPSEDCLMLQWAYETKYKGEFPDEAFLARMLNNTYKPERWPSVVALANLAKILSQFESGSLSEKKREILLSGWAALQQMKNPGEEFWRFLAGQEVKQGRGLYETVKRRDPVVAETLHKEALLGEKDLRKAIISRNEPVVYFVCQPREDVLAQMCVYAYQQTKKEIYAEFLLKYCGKIGKDKNAASYTANNLLNKWRTPPSPESLKAFIKKTTKAAKEERTEVLERLFKGRKPDFPVTVEKAAMLLYQEVPGGEPKSIARWLYYQLEGRKVSNAGCSGERITPGWVVVKRNWYLLDEKGFEKAKQLWQIGRAHV